MEIQIKEECITDRKVTTGCILKVLLLGQVKNNSVLHSSEAKYIILIAALTEAYT